MMKLFRVIEGKTNRFATDNDSSHISASQLDSALSSETKPEAVVTIGNFDGVHRGHQAILELLVAEAKQQHAKATVVTFEPYPQEFFMKEKAAPRLSRFSEKWELLQNCGVEQLCSLKFCRRLSQMSPDDFVDEILVKLLNTKHLIIGDDFRFGRDRQGDYHFLQKSGKEKGFTVTHTPTLCDNNRRISSTLIREALRSGDIAQAQRLLGHPYRLIGRVKHGDKRGRTIGFPTANVALNRRVCALSGVFAVQATTPDGKILKGVANIGTRPTFNGENKQLEAHWFDFDGDLYGQKLKIDIIAKIREEQKFAGMDALIQQIKKDCENARKFC